MSLFFIASKIFDVFILKGAVFIAAFFASSFYAKKFKSFFLALSLVLVLFSFAPFAYFLQFSLEKPYFLLQPNGNEKAVVVLGGGSYENSPNFPLTEDASKRLLFGYTLSKSKNIPLVFTGGGVGEKSEAFWAKKFLQDLGVEQIEFEKTIFFEDKSLTTAQNAVLTSKLFDEKNIEKNIFLVTSAYHTKRGVAFFEKNGFLTTPAPTDFKTNFGKKVFWDYIPNLATFQTTCRTLHEYVGLLLI